MGRLFGTDGVRGLAGGDVLTAELAFRLAGAAALELLAEELAHGAHPLVVIGRDTRPSGPMLEAAPCAPSTTTFSPARLPTVASRCSA